MPERPLIEALGRIARVREPGRLYEVEMPNGHRAFAVVERKGPPPPAGADAPGEAVRVHFSPYDMSRCRVAAWPSDPAPGGSARPPESSHGPA